MVLEPEQVKGFDIDNIKAKLHPHKNIKAELNPDVFIGRINNLIVKHKNGRIYITGSLPKVLNGNNLIIPSIDEILALLQAITEVFELPIKLARIVGIDIGFDFEMNQPVKIYQDCFLDTPGFFRYKHNNSIYYKRDNYTLIFYDKTKEVKKNRYDEPTSNLPKGFEDKHILRYEIRFHSRVDNLFKFGVVRTLLLHSTTFRKALLEKWKKHYFDINKAKNLILGDQIKNAPDFKKQIALNGIDKLGGRKRLMAAVKDHRNNGVITPKSYESIQTWLRKISKNDNQFAETDYIVELNQKVSEVIEF